MLPLASWIAGVADYRHRYVDAWGTNQLLDFLELMDQDAGACAAPAVQRPCTEDHLDLARSPKTYGDRSLA